MNSNQFFERSKFYRLKNDFLAKSPLDKWLHYRRLNIFLLELVGAGFMAENYKVQWKTWIPMYLGVNYFSLLIYTGYYYRNEPFKALQPTVITGIMVPGLVLYFLILMPSTRKQYRRLYNFAGDYIYANSENSPKNHVICNKMAIGLITSSLITNFIVILSVQLSVIVPLYQNFFTDEHEMLIPVVLPFVDPETEKGFFCNLANQLTMALVGAIQIPATELITCVLKNNILAIAAVVENTIQEFQNLLELDGTFSDDRIWQFRNIILKTMDFERYVVSLAEFYYWKFLLQPIFLMYSISLALCFLVLYNWTTAIGGSLCAYVQLLILCDVGKTVDDANQTILEALNRFPFYLLPQKKQEMFAFVLGYMQHPAKLRIGPFAELNYGTATNLTKMIYTYVMMLLNQI